ncbi:hypothetical protein SNEBB_010268 [Seison nebaliae]|nr:hypothetical protein SNEBB_010268 [Seison nebaliae]
MDDESKETNKCRCFIAALPVVPKKLSILFLLLNVFIPGTGTVGAGFACCRYRRSDKNLSKGKAISLNFLAGFLQLLLAPIIVGWIWSLHWGFRIKEISSCLYGINNNENLMNENEIMNTPMLYARRQSSIDHGTVSGFRAKPDPSTLKANRPPDSLHEQVDRLKTHQETIVE